MDNRASSDTNKMDAKQWTFIVQGMSCASCVAHIEKKLKKIPGVVEVSVNLATAKLVIDVLPTVSVSMLEASIKEAGYNLVEETIQLNIKGMHCASCVSHIEKILYQEPGIKKVHIDFARERAYIQGLKGMSIACTINRLEKAGYQATFSHGDENKHRKNHLSILVLIAMLLALPFVFFMLLPFLGVNWIFPGWMQFILASVVQFGLGARFFVASYRAIKAKMANMDVLVVLGTMAAYGLSTYHLFMSPTGSVPHLYFEVGVIVITLVLLGRWLEGRAKQQTTAAIAALEKLRPSYARVRKASGDVEVPIDSIQVGDSVVVRPGEAVPVDGVIITGNTEVDESLITGESLPIAKSIGETLIGGAMNIDGLVVIKVSAVGAQTALSRIIHLVETAQMDKVPIQRLVDKASAIFVPFVLLCALVTFIAWWWITQETELAMLHAVAVLVIACPCALGLATPTALTVGVGVAAKRGILIKDAEVLEVAHRITTVVFDKTGTLTEGQPSLIDWVPYQSSREGFLQIAASIQQGNTHPLAYATVAQAQALGLTTDPVQLLNVFPGRGVAAQLHQMDIRLGNTRFMQELHIDMAPLLAVAQEYQQSGHTVAWMARVDGTPTLLGLLVFSDRMRITAKKAVDWLHKLGIRTVLLSGDNQASAETVGHSLGIKTILAEALPQDKVAYIKSLKQANQVIAMMGDGINDAPALAAADVGIAISTGADVALHAAGVTLLHADLSLVGDAIDISRKTYHKIKENLFWAFVYNCIGIPLAAFGWLNPMIAGAAMALSSLSVVSNALLLKRWRGSL